MSQVSDILGEEYAAETLELDDDYEGRVVATLVHRRTTGQARGAVLHVHGYCDYFFQDRLAGFYVDLGFDFYALDLRKHGRSLLAHQTPNFCRDLDEYYPELDAALHRIRRRDGHRVVVLSGHSTGGLIGPLWADTRRAEGAPPAEAVVLNSPWLDLQGSLLMRTAGTRAVDQLGLRRPYQVLPRVVTGLYGESLHRDFRGEWDYNLEWKPRDSFPARAGWLRAIRRGHRRVHAGIDVGAPVLVLCSARSTTPQAWNDDVACTDVVLDVRQIARWAYALGSQVTITRVDGALHDVLTSAEPVRKQAYAEISRWLATYLDGSPAR